MLIPCLRSFWENRIESICCFICTVIDQDAPSSSATPTVSMESTAPSSASRTPTDDNVDGSAPKADYLSEEEITIKLKYLNDSMKIVKARPSEPIGDFKK